jgi:hypothetical protein
MRISISLFFRIILIGLFLFYFNLFLSSQNLNLPGYVINNGGDTVQGFITVSSDKKLALGCNFCASQDGYFLHFSPYELKGFRFESGKYYVSREVELTKGTTRYFLEYLINGNANIYYLKDDEEHYFVEQVAGRLVELHGKEKLLKTDEGVYSLPAIYKGELNALFMDWEDAGKEVSNTRLSHGSLIELARKYHENTCTERNCIIYERHVDKIAFRFGVTAGNAKSRVIFGGLLQSTPAPGFFLGGKLEILNTTNSEQRLTYQFDLLFTKTGRTTISAIEKDYISEEVWYRGERYIIATKESVSSPGIFTSASKLDVDFNLLTLKTPLVINYQFSHHRLSPYCGIGISSLFVLSQNEDLRYTRFSKKFGQTFPSFYIGYLFKAGIAYTFNNRKSAFLTLSYDYHLNTNINQFYRARLKTFGLSGGFMF